jgi:hypothetical protein
MQFPSNMYEDSWQLRLGFGAKQQQPRHISSGQHNNTNVCFGILTDYTAVGIPRISIQAQVHSVAKLERFQEIQTMTSCLNAPPNYLSLG